MNKVSVILKHERMKLEKDFDQFADPVLKKQIQQDIQLLTEAIQLCEPST